MLLMGWRRFTSGAVQIYQRDCLVDQTVIAEALTVTKGIRAWCTDDRLTIFIEAAPFRGERGALSTGEVARYSKWKKTATVRVYGGLLTVETLGSLLRGLTRVD
jgi:hypothetical protein